MVAVSPKAREQPTGGGADQQDYSTAMFQKYAGPLQQRLTEWVVGGGDGNNNSSTSDNEGRLGAMELMDPLVSSADLSADDTLDSDASSDSGGHDDGHGAGKPGSASTSELVVNIIISFVGAGLLGVPHAFSQAGWLLGSITVLVVSALNLYAMLLLPQVKSKLRSRGFLDVASYGDLGRVLLGPQGEVLVNVCLGISQAGFATAYIIFIAANLYSLAGLPRWLVCSLSIPGLCHLVSLREMKHLAPFSMLANGANFCALLAVLIQDFQNFRSQHRQHSEPDMGPVHAVNFGGLLYVIAITIYSLEGVGLILSLEASAQQPHMFGPLLKGTVGCITIFMAFFGSAGYMAFGNETLAPITLNLSNGPGAFVKCALCLGLYLTYPIMMFPIWHIAERLYPALQQEASRGTQFRIAVVCLSALVAYSVPDFGKFLSLVGSSICTILGFILPCYFHLTTFHGAFGAAPGQVEEDAASPKEWQFKLHWGLIVGGTLFGIMGTCQSFWALLHGELESEVRRLQHDEFYFLGGDK